MSRVLNANLIISADIYYRVHAQSYGWLGWAKNGAPAGTAGYAKRLEGIQIVIVKKGEKIDENKNGIKSVNKSAYIALSGTSPVVNSKPTSSMNPTIEGNSTPNVTYRTHVQTYGWQGWKFNFDTFQTFCLSTCTTHTSVKLPTLPAI